MDSLIDFIFRNLGLDKVQQQLVLRSAWVALVTGHILWACGWLSILGVSSPFASAQDLKTTNSAVQIAIDSLQNSINEDRLERLEHDILQTKTSYCKASNEEARRQYAQRIQELLDRYFRLAKGNARVPTCDEV